MYNENCYGYLMIDLDKIDIYDFLTHRPSFLFLDKIITLNNKEVLASILFKEDKLFVDNNCFNKIGLFENTTQTCSLIVSKSYFDNNNIKREGAKLISKFDTESDVFGRYSICLFPAIGLSILNISE